MSRADGPADDASCTNDALVCGHHMRRKPSMSSRASSLVLLRPVTTSRCRRSLESGVACTVLRESGSDGAPNRPEAQARRGVLSTRRWCRPGAGCYRGAIFEAALCSPAGGDSGRSGRPDGRLESCAGTACHRLWLPTPGCRFRNANAFRSSPGRCTGIGHGFAMTLLSGGRGGSPGCCFPDGRPCLHPNAAVRRLRETSGRLAERDGTMRSP